MYGKMEALLEYKKKIIEIVIENRFIPIAATVLFFILMIVSCNLEKSIDVDLPSYESELVVECYLEPGKPYRLFLSESQAYFDEINENPLIENALVTISHQGVTDTLPYGTYFNTEFNKIYNYQSNKIVPENYYEDFSLYIKDDRGREITGTTQIIEAIEIDSLVLQFNNTDTAALVLTYFIDPPGEDNWYRRHLHSGLTIDGGVLDQDFITDDKIETENDQFVFGSAFDYTFGDTIYSTLYHIDEPYFDFLQSTFDAIGANGNPFATPAQIKSTVTGGLGVFTGLSYDRDTLIIQ